MSTFRDSVDSSYIWLGLYFVLNLGLTLFNKAVLNAFRFPWTLTAIHTLCGSLGSYLLYLASAFPSSQQTVQENFVMIMFSFLYTINIAISNVSLSLVSIAVVRAMTPVFTVFISVMFLQQSFSSMTYWSLLPVVAGVGFATFGEYDYIFIGFVLTVLGTALAAIKTVATNRILVGQLQLHPLDVLLRMSPLAFVQCLAYGYFTGELSKVQEFLENNMTTGLATSLAMNGTMAFALNIVSFTANKKTSALTMTVAANVKQVLSIILAVVIFGYRINLVNAFGILLTLAGGAWYSKIELSEKSRPAPVLPTASQSPVPVHPSHDSTLEKGDS